MSSLSRRGLRFKNFVSGLAVVESKYYVNPYSENNHEGIINLGTSENRLMFDILNEKFNDPSSHVVQEKYTNYSAEQRGYESFRTAVAKVMNHYMKPFQPIQSDDLIAMNGCGSCIESLGMTLADPGDGFLIPAPYYGGFVTDLMMRAGIQLVPVNTSSEITKDQTSPFELTVDLLEKAYDDATQKDIKIRALLLVNPNNPFGYIYSDKQMRDFLQFAHRHEIHVIVDELYMLSIFKEGCTMKCALSYDDIPDPERLHVLWGLSKDFCVSGFRCGVIHTVNKDVKDAIAQIIEFQSVSPLVQHVFTNILNDLDWINDVYIPTNHKRLRHHYGIISETLRKCGIPFVEAVAGFYVWVDFRELLKHKTHDDEFRLYDIFIDNKLYLIPGVAFATDEPGWFRIVFSQKTHVMKLAMERLSKAIAACREEIKN